MKKTLFVSLLSFALFSASSAIAQIGYKDLELGECYDSVIEKLQQADIEFKEQADILAEEVGVKNGVLVEIPFWGDDYFYDRHGNKLHFTVKTTKREIRYRGDNGTVFLYFDNDDILMQIFVNNLTINWEAMKQSLITKYGPPASDHKDRLTMILKWILGKDRYSLQLAQYIDGTGRQVVYTDQTLLLNHWKMQYAEKKKEYDLKIENETEKASGF